MIQHPPLYLGQIVLTADKSRLGTISEVRGPHLRLQRRLRRSIWLPIESILWVDNERVVMAFKAEDLHRYQRRRQPSTTQPVGAFVRVVRPNHSPYVRAADAIAKQTNFH